MNTQNTHLIIIEGLPATGKSTLASIIADKLKKEGISVVFADEGAKDHPADYAQYDFCDFETEREKISEKLRTFVKTAADDTVYVFNCIFLQNPMCETMMRFGMDMKESERYICGIADIIRPMKPKIIYISLPDVKSAVDGVLAERGEEWLNAVIDYHVGQGYGKSNGLKGYEGYISCLIERKKRELAILKETRVDSLIVNRKTDPEEIVRWIKK